MDFTDPSDDYMSGGDGDWSDNDEGTVTHPDNPSWDDTTDSDDPEESTDSDRDWSYEGDETSDPWEEPDPGNVGGISPPDDSGDEPSPSTPTGTLGSMDDTAMMILGAGGLMALVMIGSESAG